VRAGQIPDYLQQFIHQHIHSVEQLEVLLLLRSEPQKWWSAAEVSKRLFTIENSAAMRLAALHDCHFLQKKVEDGHVPLYRYEPLDEETDDTIGALDRFYRERKDTVIQVIFSPPSNRAKSFADAFKFRRDDS